MKLQSLFLLLFALLMAVSCGHKKEELSPLSDPDYWRRFYPPCSEQERKELDDKIAKDYPFIVPLKKMKEQRTPIYCQYMREFIQGIDQLPPKVKREFDRRKDMYNLKIYIAGERVTEYGKYYPEWGPAAGYYSGYLDETGGTYIVVCSTAGKRTLWHEIGHFIDQASARYIDMHIRRTDYFHDIDGFSEQYTKTNNEYEGKDLGYFGGDIKEGFPESFMEYIQSKTENTKMSELSHKIYDPFFEFFDKWFDIIDKKFS